MKNERIKYSIRKEISKAQLTRNELCGFKNGHMTFFSNTCGFYIKAHYEPTGFRYSYNFHTYENGTINAHYKTYKSINVLLKELKKYIANLNREYSKLDKE